MRKVLPIASLLLYACAFRAEARASQVRPVGQDTALYPIVTLASPASRPMIPAPSPHSSPGRPVSSSPARPVPGKVGTPSLTSITLRVFNPSPQLTLTNLKLEWALEVNGSLRQRGATAPLSVAPQHTSLVHIPARMPGGDSNEIFLRLRCLRIPPKILPAHPILLSEEQLLVHAPNDNTPEVRPDGELTFTDENDTFTIHSPLIHIEFNKQTGWLQRYDVNGAVLLTDTPVLKSNFWLPPGPQRFAQGEAGDAGDSAWQEASHDPHLQLFSTSTGNTMIIVRAEYTLPATSCLLHVSYTINAKGEMLVGEQVEADSTQKGEALPCFGMRWLLPADYDSIEYYGLGRTARDSSRDSTHPGLSVSDSTNPLDSIRLHAPWIGIYHDTDSHLISAIRWIRISDPEGNGLLIAADSTLLNAGTLQTTPSVLLHIDSRQPAASGIPGDNRQLSYKLPYGNYRCSFKVSPIISHHAAATNHP